MLCTTFLLFPSALIAFVSRARPIHHRSGHEAPFMVRDEDDGKISVTIETKLTDEKVTELFAWVSRAFAGDDEYNNLMLAIAVVFGNLSKESMAGAVAHQMKEDALAECPLEEELVGEPFSTDKREIASLGAMGAAQWTGQFRTRPHALLDVTNFTCVDDWVKTLPRGCKRTIKRALAQNFTVVHKPIEGGMPAAHSSLAHFRCVIAHEVRLLAWGAQGFFDALAEGVSRYMGTTRMTGDIYEYRDSDGKVVAIAHEVHKGNVIRGQWFYCDDWASKHYVWFHSVHSLVERAIEQGIGVVDLGPSGSDSFSELKAKYGFVSVDDWTQVADYTGPFHYSTGRGMDGTDYPTKYEKQLQVRSRFPFY
mgnify:CR=1 FL=1